MEFQELLAWSIVVFCSLCFYVYYTLWLGPEKIRRKLMKQDIGGPAPTFFYGNVKDMKRMSVIKEVGMEEKQISHEFTLFPYFNLWRNEYGSVFAFSTGNKVTVYVAEPAIIKEIMLCTSLSLGKPSYLRKNRGALLGNSVVSANGLAWVNQRKILAPEFFMDKVKRMVRLMVEETLSLLKSWDDRAKLEGGIADIRVDEDLKNLSADVIARACFGRSYSKGKEVFSKIETLIEALSVQNYLNVMPGYRYLPNKSNRDIWKLDKEIHSLILKMADERRTQGEIETDLLQTILESNDYKGTSESDRFIVDNCKAIYFAGHETTATTIKWVLILLASNPEWQTRVRDELAEICGCNMPDLDMLRKMKLLNMVIQETMRLYSAAPYMLREVLQEMKLGPFLFLKGVTIYIPTIPLQQDPDIWGPDAREFNPERFVDGISGACKHPHLYMPFGFGPRLCLGQNFAMVEMKIVLSLILTRFEFMISPRYRHCAVHKVLLGPKFGANLLIKKV